MFESNGLGKYLKYIIFKDNIISKNLIYHCLILNINYNY